MTVTASEHNGCSTGDEERVERSLPYIWHALFTIVCIRLSRLAMECREYVPERRQGWIIYSENAVKPTEKFTGFRPH